MTKIPLDSHELHHEFSVSPRPHVLMVTNHGVHEWQIVAGLPDTGGQNVFVNQFSGSLAKLGYRITIVNRGGFPHPVSGEDRCGLVYKDAQQRILYIEDSVPEFVRKEDMPEHLDELADDLRVKLLGDLIPDLEATEVIISHYWDGAQVAERMNRSLPRRLHHIWIPHSLGTIKKANIPEPRWEALRIDERIALEREMVEVLDGIASTSTAIEHALHDDYGYEGQLVLRPCIDTDRYSPWVVAADEPIWRLLAEHSGLDEDEIRASRIISEVSRTDKTKRKDVVIRAFARVLEQHPDAFLAITIDDHNEELHEELRSLISGLEIAERVAVLGSIWEWVPSLFAVTSIYCTPSEMEGFGMSIQEAAAMEVPAVSSDLVPFAVEYLCGPDYDTIEGDGPYEGTRVQRGPGAFVVEPGDVDGFAFSLDILLSDDALRSRMSRQAFEITIPSFTWNRMSRAFLSQAGLHIPEPDAEVPSLERLEFAGGRLSRDGLAQITEYRQVDELGYDEIRGAVLREPGIEDFAPDGVCQVDPRNDERVIYNSARARRPHDNRPEATPEPEEAPRFRELPSERPCVICQGATTRAIDVQPLSEGQTFLNKNLFPILHPGEMPREAFDPESGGEAPGGLQAHGLHLLQWSSTEHDRDWQNMPVEDGAVAMQRLARLEERLLTTGPEEMAPNTSWGDERETRGFVAIIKNFGRLVGGSLDHGHQQIAYSNVMPRRFLDNLRFEQRHGKKYTDHLLETNPSELELRDYGRVMLLVPYFMRRPFDMQLVVKDTSRRYLHQLDGEELEQVARGWRDAIGAIHHIMPAIGRELAYNVVTHNGPGAGLYFEFLPYTQETGGYEHLGLYLCQALPRTVAGQLREILDEAESAD